MTRSAVFPVTMTKSSIAPVTVDYATVAGTTVAGTDFTQQAGTITFAPGETSKSVSVPIRLTDIKKASGFFNLLLSNPTSATILSPVGTCTIPGETLSYLTASGEKLFNETGDQFIPQSINWYGFEQIFVAGGAYSRNFVTKTVNGVVKEGILNEIKRLGFNSLRVLFSEDVTWPNTKPETRFNYWNTTYINPDLNSEFLNDTVSQNPQNVKKTIEILDIFVGWCESLNLRIIFDLHCLAPDDDNVLGTNGKWYTTATPGAAGATSGAKREPRSEAQAIAAHVFLANRYKNRPVVCGFDLINEPHNTTWDRDPLTGVVGFYERCGNAIHVVNPNVLIGCEGVSEKGMNNGCVDHTPVGHEIDLASTQGKYLWGTIWSGKLDEVARINNMRVTLNIPNKVVYSPHEYGSWPTNAHQWYDPGTYVGASYAGLPFPQNMSAVWSRQWGYLAEQHIAPVWIGEVGSYLKINNTLPTPYTQDNLDKDIAWLTALNTYMRAHSIGFSWWAINPGGDPDGLLDTTWGAALPYKAVVIAPLLAP
jgi:endoglucanase